MRSANGRRPSTNRRATLRLGSTLHSAEQRETVKRGRRRQPHPPMTAQVKEHSEYLGRCNICCTLQAVSIPFPAVHTCTESPRTRLTVSPQSRSQTRDSADAHEIDGPRARSMAGFG